MQADLIETESAINGLSALMGLEKPLYFRTENMQADERGFSGALLLRARAVYKNGETRSMILKKTSLKECGAVARLNKQGFKNIPRAFSVNCENRESALLAMEDLTPYRTAADENYAYKQAVAAAMAKMHALNIGKGAEMPFLPRADCAYWQSLTTEISVSHFESACKQSNEFNRRFARLLPDIYKSAERFCKAMTALYNEGESLTLTHGDICPPDAKHIYNCGGAPYFIDFGFCSYAPFYIDAASCFDCGTAEIYYNELKRCGITLSRAEFNGKFQAAQSYTGFIYLYPAIANYLNAPTAENEKRLQDRINIILQ